MTPERLYAGLLRLYPKPFRDEYGASMSEAFRDLRASNRRSPLALWRFVVSDIVRSAVHEQLDACCTGSRRFALRWLATCAIGLIVTVFVANTVAWILSYFYHPYFEGLTIPPWGYGTCLGLVLGGTIGLSQWMLLPTHLARARAWALASGIALPIATLLCAAVVERTLVGVNPVAANPTSDALGVLIPGLQQAKDWTAFAIQFVAMGLSGLVVGSIAMRSHAERRHAH
jgi:FtsH-binding integral membrane protein